ncbi:MAG: DUF86 domain-containing protein [Saprospiraceae bacterium]|nr:DUF86 domain-containing protein [Saprospiraceae bacterium]
MQEEIKVWLEDIEKAIAEINDFLPVPLSFFAFQKDLKSKRAVERNIEILGEAMRRILQVEPDIPISNSRKIVDTRNRITHGYDSVSDDVIWLIVVKYLPILDKEIKQIINNN